MGAPAVLAGMAGGAAAGAVNTAVNGGNLGVNILAGAALGGIAAGIGGPLAQSLGGGWTGAIGSGALLGAGFGGLGAAVSGGNVLEGILAGAITGAVLAAAVYGGCKAWDAINSPTLAAAAGPSGGEAGRCTGECLGAPLEGREAVVARGAADAFADWEGIDTSGLEFYKGGTSAHGVGARLVDGYRVVLNRDFFTWSQADQFRILGHEFSHFADAARIPGFWEHLGSFNRYYGYFRNPLEVSADQSGAAFASHLLREPVRPHPDYAMPRQ